MCNLAESDLSAEGTAKNRKVVPYVMQLERYCVKEHYTIKEVLEQFESYNNRVAIVTGDSDKVIGVVSQGDILRAFVCRAEFIYTGQSDHQEFFFCIYMSMCTRMHACSNTLPIA